MSFAMPKSLQSMPANMQSALQPLSNTMQNAFAPYQQAFSQLHASMQNPQPSQYPQIGGGSSQPMGGWQSPVFNGLFSGQQAGRPPFIGGGS